MTDDTSSEISMIGFNPIEAKQEEHLKKEPLDNYYEGSQRYKVVKHTEQELDKASQLTSVSSISVIGDIATDDQVHEVAETNEGATLIEVQSPSEEKANIKKVLTVFNDTYSSEQSVQTVQHINLHKFEYELSTGLLKPQINNIISAFFVEYTPYWEEGVEFNQEWFGSYKLVSQDRWELLNQVLKSYGLSLKVKKNDVLHFSKVNN